MKTILYVLILMSLFSLAFRPGTPPPPPPPTEPPPVITEPPGTEPPEVTEPPGTEEPAPTERGRPNPEQQVTPGPGKPEAEQRVIKLPQGGYGQPEHDLYYWLRWFLLVLAGFVGVWAAAWSLKR